MHRGARGGRGAPPRLRAGRPRGRLAARGPGAGARRGRTPPRGTHRLVGGRWGGSARAHRNGRRLGRTLYPWRHAGAAPCRPELLVPVFSPVPPDIDFVALEQAELARWATHRVFERSIEQREGAAPWVFYEGPPTANGMPGLHHVWARVYKDLFCRFRTMAGAFVARRAGWDTHGLPVEVEVEKKLGITGKKQIEEQVGIAEFTRLCRESVYSYVDDFARLTTRIGYWVDMDSAYWTLDSSYIESVWWHLQQMFDQGLLYEDVKVVPYCPRCGTALSSHELGQPDVYRDEEDESAYVRLPLLEEDAGRVGG
ncbi:MAG: class I tRNA ligase family protein, partial [Acidimicrobiales bacterium]|nr:class I tRNA ligase family protein [Acidimicrobiales bacterium]